MKIEPSLASFLDDMSLENKQIKVLESFIKVELTKPSKSSLILVAHHVNIEAYAEKGV